MIRFSIKFLIVSILFFVPASFFHYRVQPNISGDLGRLGMIPFGKEYVGHGVSWYYRDIDCSASVEQITNPDSLCHYKVITIGDSFSQIGNDGYQYSLSGCLGYAIANVPSTLNITPIEKFLALLNDGYIKSGQTVVVETVERYYVDVFSKLESLDTYTYCDYIEMKHKSDKMYHGTSFLSLYFSWIRLSVGFDNPVGVFPLTKDCFTHCRFSNTLFFYNSTSDGDLHWRVIPDERYIKAASNMEKIISLSENKGINLILMIAIDKYDAYQPWIEGNPAENPTINHNPHNKRIYITRDCIRKAIDNGIKDVYNVNDTHWSVVGADIVGVDLYEWMQNQALLPEIEAR